MSAEAPAVAETVDHPTVAQVAAEPSQEPAVEKRAVEEPQNALTKLFTEEEWKGVKALRAKLPEIAEEVHEDKSKTLNLWGVELSAVSPTAKSSVVLVKFIRARPGNIKAAEDMLIATLKWRKEFKVDEIKAESFPEDVFGAVGVVSGKDKDGRPVTFNFYGRVDPNVVFKDVDQFIRWRVGLMERGVALIDFETIDSMVQVHDYEGVSLTGRTANSKAAASAASKIFGDYYPELLYKKFFVSVPAFFTWLFWAITKVLPSATQSKMTLVGSGPANISAALLPLIDKSQLPKRYGGEGEDI